MDPAGIIFKIERLAVHDGPGIRTVVFFKGCPLRCQWCSSPESQNLGPEVAHDPARCIRCHRCVFACPQKALSILEGGGLDFDRRLCTACGECVQACEVGARWLVGWSVHASEVLREIEKDEIFYHRSGGGVTLSGGEPALQAEFAGKILEGASYRGLHTAMETCGAAEWDVFASLMPLLDLIYVDLKITSARRHRAMTGRDNARILRTLKNINGQCRDTELVVRVPVVPGVNDDADNLGRIAEFLHGLGRLKRVELLPYHRYGVRTYDLLDRRYELPDVMPPSLEEMHELAGLFTSRGISAGIGG